MTNQNLVEFARSYWDAEARRDTASVLEHYAPEAVLEHPGGTVSGHDELRAFYDAGAASFPELEVEIVHSVSNGNEAALEWLAVLIDGSGRRFPVRGTNVVRVENGKFTSVRTYYQAPAV